MKAFRLVISTPDGNIFDEDILKISLRGVEGDLAIMANHIPFVTSVKPCICKIETGDKTERKLSVENGILSVGAEVVTLMSGGCNWVED